ncbi:Acyl-coenzyme A thioesterase 9, mitochondrial [Strongyloides ratti]|uniref:Acyl-coenzyme A thioesterase 9, mitochondrial n=1 Tax=Strongyloides ratti TaxID=34506 RepID=A0A090L8C0_STRRB|nr:Acyl-coenzyme A thioesterase 9, mitochondrial [Strongyloides ratti]CEF63700.1 Acyl-coenzyme A thioesterase 9, mitochondrial [Strongyloides ratti]
MKTTYYMRSHVDNFIDISRKNFSNVKSLDNVDEKILNNNKISMTSSRCQFKIPLKESELVRRMYTSTKTNLRIGKLLEDLDMFAVYLTHHYADGNIFKYKNLHNQLIVPRTVVTAAIGQLTLNKILDKNDEDLIFDGFVSYVGKTSAQTTIRLYQKQNNIFQQLMECKVIIVSKNLLNMNETLKLPPMKLESEKEKKLFKEGEKYVEDLKKLININISEITLKGLYPYKMSREIKSFINRLDKDNFSLKDLTSSETTINSTSHWNTFMAYAQTKNFNGTVFGGLIMRKGIELATLTASKFCEDHAYLVSLGNIAFRQTIDIGSIIDLGATITYVDEPYIQVRIFYEVSSVNNLFQKYTSNIMQCTFKYDGPNKLKKLHLDKADDIIKILDGKLHLEETKKALNANFKEI